MHSGEVVFLLVGVLRVDVRRPQPRLQLPRGDQSGAQGHGQAGTAVTGGLEGRASVTGGLESRASERMDARVFHTLQGVGLIMASGL